MLKDKASSVDLTKPEDVLQIFPRPPIYTSSAARWNGIQLQHHHQPAWETIEHCYTKHVIDVSEFQEVAQIERKFDNQRQGEKISTGEVAIVPAGMPHKMVWDKEGDCTLLILDPVLVKRVAYESTDRDRVELVPRFDKPDPLIYQIASALKNILQVSPQNSKLYAESMTTALVAHLLQHYSAQKPVIEDFTGGIPKYKLQQAIDYINAHLAEDISLEAIASVVSMSQYHFARLFKQSTGFSPYQYALQCRVNRGKKLLLQGKLGIAEVALEVGFSSQSHFTQSFKKIIGVTPKQLIKQ